MPGPSLAGRKRKPFSFLLGEDKGVSVLDPIAAQRQPILQDLTLELQLLLLSGQPLLVFNLLLQAQDEAFGVKGIGVAPPIGILHKDLDLAGEGLHQTEANVGEDAVRGQGALGIEELSLATRLLEGQLLHAQGTPALPDLLLNLLYGLIRVHPKDQV